MKSNYQHSRALPYIIITLAALFYVYEFALRVMPSAMTDELMLHFNIDASGLGMLSALFFYGYAPMQIPAGMLIDRLGARKLLSTSVLICSLGALVLGMTDQFFIAGIGRTMTGVGSAFAYIGCLVLASAWFEAKYFALIAGLVQFMGCLGAIGGAAPIALIVQRYGWQRTQVASAVVGILLSVLFWLFIRDYPPKAINKVKKKHARRSDTTEMQRLKKVLSNKQTWAVGLYGFCCWAPISIFAVLWGIPFITVLHNSSTTEAAMGIAYIWGGIAVFSPIVGWWSNRINSRRIPLITSAIIAIITSIILIYVDNVPWALDCVVLFFFGAAASAMSVTFGMVQDNMPPSVAGTAVGFNNMAIIGAGVIFQPIVGLLLDANMGTKALEVLPSYTLSDYRHALFIIPLLGVVSLLTSLFLLKETHCTAQYDLPKQE